MNIIPSQELDERSEEPESEVKSKERFTLPKPKPPKTGREVKKTCFYIIVVTVVYGISKNGSKIIDNASR